MTYPGPQLNQLQQHAGEAAQSVAGDPVEAEVGGGPSAPPDALCASCGTAMLERQNVRRGPSGLRHESCP